MHIQKWTMHLSVMLWSCDWPFHSLGMLQPAGSWHHRSCRHTQVPESTLKQVLGDQSFQKPSQKTVKYMEAEYSWMNHDTYKVIFKLSLCPSVQKNCEPSEDQVCVWFTLVSLIPSTRPIWHTVSETKLTCPPQASTGLSVFSRQHQLDMTSLPRSSGSGFSFQNLPLCWIEPSWPNHGMALSTMFNP